MNQSKIDDLRTQMLAKTSDRIIRQRMAMKPEPISTADTFRYYAEVIDKVYG